MLRKRCLAILRRRKADVLFKCGMERVRVAVTDELGDQSDLKGAGAQQFAAFLDAQMPKESAERLLGMRLEKPLKMPRAPAGSIGQLFQRNGFVYILLDVVKQTGKIVGIVL